MSQQRRSALTASLACLVVLLATVAPAADSQGKSSGTYLVEAVTRVTDNAARAAQAGNYGYADGICILGAWVDAGKSIEFNLPLNGNTDYLFIAGGDKDAEDVDFFILDQNGNVLKQDTSTAADAAVAFTPRANGTYVLKVTLYKAQKNVPCVCVATVLKKNGWTVPLRNLDTATGKLVGTLAVADQDLKRANKRLDLRKANNQWAVYGAVLREGTEVGVSNMDLGKGTRAFLGVGDDNAQDVDLFLLDGRGNAIKEDTRLDPTATIVHNPAPGAHGLRIRNYKSRGPAVVMMAVFDVIE